MEGVAADTPEKSFLVAVFTITAASAQYRDTRSGYDGDFFSLEGAIELFKNSRNLQAINQNIIRPFQLLFML